MSLYLQVLWFVTLTGTAYAFFRGAGPERWTAIVLVIWFWADPAYHRIFGPPQFRVVDAGHLALDGTELIALGLIALGANRLWPLWVTAAQLVVVTGHLAVMFGPIGTQDAYWAITQLPIFPQLVALMLGTVAHEQRLRRIGAYRDWRLT